MTNGYEVRDGLYYTWDHVWAKIEDGLARVGVTDYAQKKIGEIVYAELPEVGKQVQQLKKSKTKEMELGTVESIKGIIEVYSPLSGTIKEMNSALEDKPELINTSPYDDGWICVMEPSNLDAELKELMDAKGYSEYLKTV